MKPKETHDKFVKTDPLTSDTEVIVKSGDMIGTVVSYEMERDNKEDPLRFGPIEGVFDIDVPGRTHLTQKKFRDIDKIYAEVEL